MFVARMTSNIILEDASSSEVDYNRLISGQTYDVAKFVPDILANFFQENYSLFPEVQESNRRPTWTKPTDQFRNLGTEIREEAYKAPL